MNNNLKWEMKKWADIYLNNKVNSFNSKDVLIDYNERWDVRFLNNGESWYAFACDTEEDDENIKYTQLTISPINKKTGKSINIPSQAPQGTTGRPTLWHTKFQKKVIWRILVCKINKINCILLSLHSTNHRVIEFWSSRQRWQPVNL